MRHIVEDCNCQHFEASPVFFLYNIRYILLNRKLFQRIFACCRCGNSSASPSRVTGQTTGGPTSDKLKVNQEEQETLQFIAKSQQVTQSDKELDKGNKSTEQNV